MPRMSNTHSLLQTMRILFLLSLLSVRIFADDIPYESNSTEVDTDPLGTGEVPVETAAKRKVRVCFKGKTIRIPASKLDKYTDRGATKGACVDETQGNNFNIITDLNDPRLFTASLRSDKRTKITFYGTKQATGSITKVTTATYESKGSLTTFNLDGNDRLKVARNAGDKFELTLGYGNNQVFADLQLKDKKYTGSADLGSLRRLEEDEMDLEDAVLEEKTMFYGLRRRLSVSSRRVLVTLKACGQALNGATVNIFFEIISGNKAVFDNVIATPEGKGVYSAAIPVAWDRSENVQPACRKAVSAVNPACTSFLDALKLKNLDKRNAICDQIGKGNPDDVAKACKKTLSEAFNVCSVILPVNDGRKLNVEKVICEKSLRKGFNFKGDKWVLAPQIIYPFQYARNLKKKSGKIPSQRQDTKLGPFSIFNGPSIGLLSTKPALPKPNNGYTFEAEVSCVSRDDKDRVVLTVSGSDSYKDNIKCALPKKARANPTVCELKVPGGRANVNDKCKVTINNSQSKSLTVQF